MRMGDVFGPIRAKLLLGFEAADGGLLAVRDKPGRPLSDQPKSIPTKEFGHARPSSPPSLVQHNIRSVGVSPARGRSLLRYHRAGPSTSVCQPFHRLEGKSRAPFARVRARQLALGQRCCGAASLPVYSLASQEAQPPARHPVRLPQRRTSAPGVSPPPRAQQSPPARSLSPLSARTHRVPVLCRWGADQHVVLRRTRRCSARAQRHQQSGHSP